ncbi:hypothetical protein [Niabella aquatica]
MRYNDAVAHQSFFENEDMPNLPITFTGDAISHLTGPGNSFDINEWTWHVEVINGKRFCVVTDKVANKERNDIF